MKVEPIRSLADIQKIKSNLGLRDTCLFTLGINSAFRASDLLSIQIKHVKYLQAGESFELKEKKTQKHRRVTVNQTCIDSIRNYLHLREHLSDSEPLFVGQRGKLTVCTLNRMVKSWCLRAGLKGNFGSHTLRKTWGYHQRVTFNSDVPTLMIAFNHSSQKQTLDYLGVQSDEIKSLYMNQL